VIRVIKVTGDSLSPSFHDGDYVLVATAPPFINRIRPGDIIVFEQENIGTMIKKVDHINRKTGWMYVIGSHEHSVDSNRLGMIDRKSVIGKVICHIPGSRS
jgi:phage repressor protein C with HTH and peptisase S24 domain